MPRKVIRAALAHCSPHQSRFDGIERVYKEVVIRWRKCIVRAKSGTSLERETRRTRNTTLYQCFVSCGPLCGLKVEGERKTHHRRLFNIQTKPSIHPIVVSPLNAFQLRTRSNEKAVP
jgi:hypothetical protein